MFFLPTRKNPISKITDVRGPNAILRTPGPDIPKSTKIQSQKMLVRKKIRKNIFSMIFICDKKAIPDVSHTFMF